MGKSSTTSVQRIDPNFSERPEFFIADDHAENKHLIVIANGGARLSLTGGEYSTGGWEVEDEMR